MIGIVGLEAGQPLERREREVLLVPPQVQIGHRRHHRGVGREPALDLLGGGQRLRFLMQAPVALGQLDLEPRLAGRHPRHHLVLLERLVVATGGLEQLDQAPLHLELVGRLGHRLLVRGDRLILIAGLLVEPGQRAPLEGAAARRRPLLLVVREQGREVLLASVDVDDARGQLGLEVVAARHQLDRAAVGGDRRGVVALLLVGLTQPRHDLDLARRIAAEPTLGVLVHRDRVVVLAGGHQRIAQLEPQGDVAGLERDVLLEVAAGAVDVLGRQREIGQRAQGLHLHRLARVGRDRLVEGGARLGQLAGRAVERPQLDQHRGVGACGGGALEQGQRGGVVALVARQPTEHDQGGEVVGLARQRGLVLRAQERDGAIAAVEVEQLGERVAVAGVAREDALQARDHRLVEGIALHVPVIALGVRRGRSRGGGREDHDEGDEPGRATHQPGEYSVAMRPAPVRGRYARMRASRPPRCARRDSRQ